MASFDDIVQRATRRAEAAGRLREIADEFPDLIAEFADELRRAPGDERASSSPETQEARVIRYLRENATRAFLTTEIAEATGISNPTVRQVLYKNDDIQVTSQTDERYKLRKLWRYHGKRSPNGTATAKPNSRPSIDGPPTEAITAFLKMHPKGCPAGRIVEVLSRHVRTKSGNPSNVLYSTIAIMTRNGKLIKKKRAGKRAVYQLPP